LDTESPIREPDGGYAALLASVGYESRARYVASQLADRTTRVFAYTFERHRELAYERNRAFFSSMPQAAVIDEPDHAYRKLVAAEVSSLAAAWRQANLIRRGNQAEPPPLRIAVDISSMTRTRIAQTLLALHVDTAASLEVDWLYAPARFTKATGGEGPIRTNHPLQGFEGWGDPQSDVACVVGLGFEGDLALGVVDDLEPTETWLFAPGAYSEQYDNELMRRNARLFDSVSPDRIIHYKPIEPYRTLLYLEALTHELVGHNRVVLLPLGPKISALMAYLVGLSDRRKVVVWRLSADYDRRPVDRRPAGDLSGLRTNSFPRVEHDVQGGAGVSWRLP